MRARTQRYLVGSAVSQAGSGDIPSPSNALTSRRSVPHAVTMNEQQMNPWIEIAPGIRRRTVTSGGSMYQMIANLEAGSVMPAHQHPQEQIAHVLQGRMRLIVSGQPHELTAGMAYYLGANVPHGVETVENTVVLDTFSPPRGDYLAMDEKAMKK